MHSSKEDVSNTEIDWFLRGQHSEVPPPPSPQRRGSDTPTAATHTPETLHPLPTAAEASLGSVLSRSKSLPVEPPKKKGFFKSIFSKKKETERTHLPDLSYSAEPQREPMEQIRRSRSVSAHSDLDPKLEEFLRYYKSKGLDKLHHDLVIQRERRASAVARPLSSVSNSSSLEPSTTHRLDALGRPIPPHPARAPLPPALVRKPIQEPDGEKSQHTTPASTSRLGFLRRQHSAATERPSSRSSSVTGSTSGSIAGSINTPPEIVIPGLEDLPVLKCVSFDVPVFFNDPPQQIPSRSPRKGEVEILKDGSIFIHKLTPTEKKLLVSQPGGGMVVGGSGHLKIVAKGREGLGQLDPVPPTPELPYSEGVQSRAAQHHSIEVAAAEAAAEARGKAAPNELVRTHTNNEDEVRVSNNASKINIDKPMIRHNKSTASLASMAQTSEDEVFPPHDVKVPLDVLYTRCCHLREILPIPATMKQIKPNSTDPIPLLQLRNPKPSLVEVLTFSDFVSIAPVLCLSLDGVSLSSNMFRIILSSLVTKKELEKLTLRNTPLDDMGWRLLCWFLTKNTTLTNIDLTNVPNLHTNVQKPCKTAPPSNIARMECDMTSRSDMNWNLFNAALMSRNGIEELIISGAKMSDEEFDNLIEMGVSLNTQRLGLAYNDLSRKQMISLGTKLDVGKIIGMDLGYNDMSGTLGDFANSLSDERLHNSSFKFLSLNSCNLHNENGLSDRFISTTTGLKDLRYIDLSNNKKLFPSFMGALTQCLPLYSRLARIHLDYSDLGQSTLVAFAEVMPFCKTLSYISLLGNHLDYVSASALTNAMKTSKTVITLDLDYEGLPAKFSDAIGVYSVRNMQQQMSEPKKDGDEEFGNLQAELSNLLTESDSVQIDESLVESFLQKTFAVRERIHASIEDLFKLRLQGTLNTEGKEALIRFCYIDSSIEKGLHLLGKRASINQVMRRLHSENCSSHIPSPMLHTSLVRGSSANIAMSDYLENSGHTELMPFGVSQNHTDDSEIETRAVESDDLTRANDNHKLREEGSVLKLAGLITSSGAADSINEEQRSMLDNMSGENMRAAILETNDLGDIVKVLDNLKEKGMRLDELYKKTPERSSEFLDLETLKNTNSNIPDRQTIITTDSDSESGSEADASAEETELNQAYDLILDRLEKVRTNN